MADRLRAAADKFGLTEQQRAKIREIHVPFADKYKQLREERKALREEEFKALAPILTGEQREKVKNITEDFFLSPN